AVEMKRRGVDVFVATQYVYGGTSACSGSDKQTLHTACGSDRGDDFNALAAALGAGGAMDEDTAYVEAVGSLRPLASLQFMGLPIPEDRLRGGLCPQRHATQGGRPPGLMVKPLAEEAARLGVPVFNRTVGVRILAEEGPPRRAVGVIAIGARA